MKLLVLTAGAQRTASTVFRIGQNLAYWREKGVHPTVISLRGLFDSAEILALARAHDVVLLQKRLLPVQFMRALIRANPCVIYDFDDVLWERDSKRNSLLTVWRRKWQARQVFGGVAHVTSSNEYLAAFARPITPYVTVIPLAIDCYAWHPNRQENSTIGWIGATVTQIYLEPLLPALRAIQNRFPNVKIVICSEKPPSWSGVSFDFVPFVPAPADSFEPATDFRSSGFGNGPEVVRRFTFGLTPLADSSFARGKSSIKTLQYMASGVIPLVSDVGSAREFVNEGQNGFLVQTPTQWIEKLTWLLENPTRHLSEQARYDAQTFHDTRDAANSFYKIFCSVAEKRA